jgi:protein O-mannosyl-transferase
MSRLSNAVQTTSEAIDSSTAASGRGHHAAHLRAAPNSRRATWLASATIALSAVIFYANSINGVFVFDDIPWILMDPGVHKLWPLTDVLFSANPTFNSGRPVVNLTIAANYALGGTDPRGYHLVNIAIHILAGLALFGIVRRTFVTPTLRDRFARVATPLALAIALIWIVHPLQTAAVTYVIQRTEALVGLFYLLTLYCVIRGAESAHAMRWYIGAFTACLLGMGTKEVMATAPIVVLLYDRTFLSGSFTAAISRRWGLYLALAATWAVVAWTLISTGFHTGSTGPGAGGFTPMTYALTQPGVIVHYLKLTFWPSGMSLDYGWPAAASVGSVLPPALLLALLFGLTIWGLIKNSPLAFLGAWFFAILAPTSSIVPIKDAAFDHRMYLPVAAVVVLFVVGGFMLWRRLVVRGPGTVEWRKWAVPVCLLGGAVIGLGCASAARNAVFSSAADVWRDVLEKDPSRPRPHNNLAAVLIDEGKYDEAIEHCRTALAMTPGYADAENNIGHALVLKGKIDEAIPYFEAALQHYPNHYYALINLGDAFVKKDRPATAVKLYQTLLKLDPDNAKIHYDLATCLRSTGEPAAAIEHLQKAVEIDPWYAAANYDLAGLLVAQGQAVQAVPHLQRTLEMKPDHDGAHHSLAAILYQQGNAADAVRHWREAVRLKPGNSEYLSDLALVLATSPDREVRNGVEAVDLAKRAVDVSKGKASANTVAILAAAYAETGNFAQAVATARQASELAIAQHQDALAEQLNDRIKLYQSGKPLRL